MRDSRVLKAATEMALPPLYKYLDIDGAKKTLSNRTLRHAKPSNFNASNLGI